MRVNFIHSTDAADQIVGWMQMQSKCLHVRVLYNSDAPLDLKIKSNMVSDLFSLVGMSLLVYLLLLYVR